MSGEIRRDRMTDRNERNSLGLVLVDKHHDVGVSFSEITRGVCYTVVSRWGSLLGRLITTVLI